MITLRLLEHIRFALSSSSLDLLLASFTSRDTSHLIPHTLSHRKAQPELADRASLLRITIQFTFWPNGWTQLKSLFPTMHSRLCGDSEETWSKQPPVEWNHSTQGESMTCFHFQSHKHRGRCYGVRQHENTVFWFIVRFIEWILILNNSLAD